LKVVEGALYDRGKSRTNRKEADAIVADLVERMKRCFAKPEEQRLTYGVVTFNTQQQALIQDLLDEALRDNPELEWFFADSRVEPTAVKNLENVQGDERDVMVFSITFGFDVSGKFPVDFGAINREGGERRLNVAVTRARQELAVYASFAPEQLRAERSNARGVRDLKAFLEYAEKGPVAIAARNEGSVGGYESPLEEAIADALIARGWRIDPQVGVSGFRVDLGVVHPDRPGAYLAGVECDGATYHRSAAARDRDKTRQQVLENLGWRIVRVWSPDWWYDSAAAIEGLHAALEAELRRSRGMPEPQEPAPILLEPTDLPGPLRIELPDHEVLPAIAIELPQEIHSAVARAAGSSQLIARQTPQISQTSRTHYCRAELPDARDCQSRFFDASYDEDLRRMAKSVLDIESPIREDLLVRRVALAHGFGRTSANIRSRVLDLLGNVAVTEDAAGRFLWSVESPPTSVSFRFTPPGYERRSLDEIAMPELVGLVQERPDLATSDDPALALAREIGLSRLARSARDRLESALSASRGESES
jgi:very-short-patch-repair endonuclease